MALAGLAGCRRPVEKIVPFVTRPEEIDPGVPLKYATTMPFGLSSYGVVVTTNEGRPTFIEGNELHPSTRGAVNPLIQASLLELYDPDRSKSVLREGKNSSWDDFVTWWQELSTKYQATGGEGLAVLSETFNSPTLARLKRRFHETFPKAKWIAWEPISDENIYKGIEMATGRVLQPVYDFSKAKVILSLDCDFLGTESESVTATHGFTEARRVMSQSDDMNRLYAVEPSMTVTGMMADHRLQTTSTGIEQLLRKLASGIGVSPSSGDQVPVDDHWLDTVVRDLKEAGENSLVMAGRRQPAAVHALTFAINKALGNTDRIVTYYSMTDQTVSDSKSMIDMVHDMDSGQVETLVILGNNPLFDTQADMQFDRALTKVKNTVHFSSHRNESSDNCTWHVPRSHYLESWGDTRSSTGMASVIQPVIEPLYESKSDVEFISLLSTDESASSRATVRETWEPILGKSGFDNKWRKVLHNGLLSDSNAGTVRPGISSEQISNALTALLSSNATRVDAPELEFSTSSVFDGRFANNGWLQELPDPVTKLTWGNAALISPKLANEHKLENEDVVKLEVNGHSIEVPVWISPGQADNSISVALGYGRTAAGRIGNGVGINAYKLRTSDNMWFASGVTITKTGRKQELACTQDHGSMEGRPIIRENTLAGYRDKAEFFPDKLEHPPLKSLWNEHKYNKGYQWGMSIDLNACTGCNACVIGCQAENNIPVIGKEQVREGREMHWMRIDRYYAGDTNNPEVAVQPMNCQHCEMAPCEQVCPVAATSHDDEGLNLMVYNRCIGTRYCSNNCPYKVRRFNFFNYTNELPETVQMAQNPEVTVRSRGVMEKCTYCLQRIVAAKATAKKENRLLADGEIKTACQSACPAKAIVFGNINDPKSRVSELQKNNRGYRVLEELNVRPRTTYLAKLRNPNPALVDKTKSKDESQHG